MATWYVTFDEPYAVEHHGIKGQKWGTRRFQNEDGSLTPSGRERYLKYKGQRDEKFRKASEGYAAAKASGNSKKAAKFQKQMKKYQNTTVDDFLRHESNKAKAKTAVAAVAAIGVTAFIASKAVQTFNSERAHYNRLSGEAQTHYEKAYNLTAQSNWENIQGTSSMRRGEPGLAAGSYKTANNLSVAASNHKLQGDRITVNAIQASRRGRNALITAGAGAAGLGAAAAGYGAYQNRRGKRRNEGKKR